MKHNITDQQFYDALIKVAADDLGCETYVVERLLGIGGIYEVLSEEYNNSAIDLIEQQNEQEDDEEEDDEEDEEDES